MIVTAQCKIIKYLNIVKVHMVTTVVNLKSINFYPIWCSNIYDLFSSIEISFGSIKRYNSNSCTLNIYMFTRTCMSILKTLLNFVK